MTDTWERPNPEVDQRVAVDWRRIAAEFERRAGFPLERHLLVLAVMGSHSHGTYLPPEEPTAVDDVDLMGFVVPPLEYHLGLPRWEHTAFQLEELDVVLYSLDKAVRLLLKCNPNIVGMLWLRGPDYLYRRPEFRGLVHHRHLFSSMRAADAFAGYAFGQLKRMEAFSVERMDEYEQLSGALGALYDLRVILDADPNKLQHLAKEAGVQLQHFERFRALHKNYFSGYMGAKRKATVRHFGYDIKNAAHLIRLLRMGAEFLETGELHVYRKDDAEVLRAIKRGEWSLEQVKEEAERQRERVRAAENLARLPAQPDEAAVGRLLLQLHTDLLTFYSANG